jgi:hypothetical protein
LDAAPAAAPPGQPGTAAAAVAAVPAAADIGPDTPLLAEEPPRPADGGLNLPHTSAAGTAAAAAGPGSTPAAAHTSGPE